MAKLVKCKSCKTKISVNAKVCPKCGEPDPIPEKGTSLFTWIVVMLFIFGLFGAFSPNNIPTPIPVSTQSQDKIIQLKQKAKEKRLQQKKLKNAKYFSQSKEEILKDLNQKIKDKKYKEVLYITAKYLSFNGKDDDIIKFNVNTRSLMIKDNKEKQAKAMVNQEQDMRKKEQEILTMLKNLPAKKVTENYNLYKELVKMYPDNEKYNVKMKYYNDKKDLILTCGNEQSMYKFALRKAIKENPIMKKSSVYDYKMFRTGYGYAYTIYFNKTPDASNAHMILITMNKKCKILSLGGVQKSTFYLKSKRQCKKKGMIAGDNHELEVYSCGGKFQFKASNDALSRDFTKKEIKEIKNIFSTAQKKYKTLRDRQVLYKTRGLKIWVRLLSKNKWYLVFDMKSIAPNPASPEASVWIKYNDFNSFTALLR